ncbi:MAG TPA: hypothetical protein VFT59_00230 [Candidatus Saccharimonadales bacterium]|nr:hypothetical protein [Candidatus Saccharimonadales bacterium]
MLHPTHEEIELATQLDIDYKGMNGPQIRDAIRRAQASRQPRKPHRSETDLDNMRPYLELRAIAAELGIDIPARITLEDLKTRTEVGIAAILTQRGWQENTVIRFSSDAPWHAGKKARIMRTSVRWIQGIPNIALHMEGETRSYVYSAHHTILHASSVG